MEFKDILQKLREPISPDLIKSRVTHGMTESDYIEWHTAADILDDTCPDWSHKIQQIQIIGDLIVVVVSLTICGVTREGVGVDAANGEKGIKSAEHDALKRAAVKFGVARDLYKKTPNHSSPSANQRTKPKAVPDNGEMIYPAEAIGMQSGSSEKGKWEAVNFKIATERGNVFSKHFLGKDKATLAFIKESVGVAPNAPFPFELRVKVERDGQFLKIVGFFPKNE